MYNETPGLVNITVRRMKIIIKIIVGSFLIFLLAAGSLIAVKFSPYLYTKVYGNEETERLYSVYVLANNKASMQEIKEFLANNSMEYVDHPNDGVISIHADTDDHSETVVIWHKEGNSTGARFDDLL